KGSGDCASPAYHDLPPQRLLLNLPDTTKKAFECEPPHILISPKIISCTGGRFHWEPANRTKGIIMRSTLSTTGPAEVFVVGTDDQVYLHKFDSTGMPLGSYIPIPNPVKAISTNSGLGYINPGLFVIGTDNQVYVHQIDPSGNPVGSYTPIPNPVKAISD